MTSLFSAPFRSRLLTLISIVGTTFFVAPTALADRHCMPSLESYFGARHALQSVDGTCRTRLAEAFDHLEGAHELAAVCGCSELGSAVQALLGDTKADKMSCEASADQVLDFSQTMKELVDACH